MNIEVSIPANLSCITFDLDDTLWPLMPTIIDAENKLYEWLQEYYPRVTKRYSLAELTDKRSALKQFRPDIAHDVTALRLHSLLELAEEFSYQESLALEGLEYFREHRNKVTPYAETEPTLRRLSAHFTLGAITNGNAELGKTTISKYFDFCVTAEDAGACKPDAEVFQYAAKLAAVNANRMLHVGDCANADVVGANKAGMYSVWMNPARKPWPGGQTPCAVIHRLDELIDLLQIR